MAYGFLETFTGTPTTDLSGKIPDKGVGWTRVNASANTYEIGSGGAGLVVQTLSDGYYKCDSSTTADHEVYGRFTHFGINAQRCYMGCRITDENNFVGVRQRAAGTSGLRVTQVVAGVPTDLISIQAVDNLFVRLEVVGTQANLYLGGTGASPVWPETPDHTASIDASLTSKDHGLVYSSVTDAAAVPGTPWLDDFGATGNPIEFGFLKTLPVATEAGYVAVFKTADFPIQSISFDGGTGAGAYGLKFDGSDDWVDCGTPLTLSGDFEIDIEFIYDSTIANQTLLGDASDNNDVLRINSASEVLIKTGGSSQGGVALNSSLVAGQRYQWRFRRTGNVYDLTNWSDVTLIASTFGSLTAFTFNDIGRILAGGYFAGTLLSVSVKDLVTPANDRYYDFNQSSGSIVPETANAGISDGTLTGFPVDDSQWIPPSAFSNGGGNLAAYKDETKTTQYPVDIVRFTTGATQDIELHVRIPTAETAATIYFEADDVQTTQPAFGDTYGRNAVWPTASTYHLGEDPTGVSPQFVDSSGKKDMSTVGTGWVSGDSDGKDLTFEAASSQGLLGKNVSGGITGYPFTLEAEFTTTTTGSEYVACISSEFANNEAYGIRVNSGKAEIVAYVGTFNSAASTTSVNDGTKHTVQAVFRSSTDMELYVDGVSEATLSPAVNFRANQNDYAIGYLYRSSPTAYFSGTIHDVTFEASGYTDGYASARYANKSATSWGTSSAWEQAGANPVGNLTATLQQATLSSTARVNISGSVTKTLDPITLSAAIASSGSTATLAKTLENVLLTASSTVAIAGSLSKPLDAATLTSQVDVLVSSSLNKTLGDVLGSSAATVDISASANPTLQPVTLSSTAKVKVSGTAANNLEGAALVASALTKVSGTLNTVLEDATLVSNLIGRGATLEATLDNVSVTATGKVLATATLTATLEDIGTVSAGTAEITGNLTGILEDVSINASASASISASVSNTLEAAVVSSSGKAKISASLNKTLGSVVSLSTTTEEVVALILRGKLESDILVLRDSLESSDLLLRGRLDSQDIILRGSL